jgi:hypothetical protein
LFGGLFSFVPLSITQLGASVVAGLSGLVAFEIGKLIKFK